MDKLIWVSLPLLAALLALAVQVWRGRPPSRVALNVWSSVLLLVYLLGTAGLGLFWVAQQHLPVFDWHYLFGYLTLVLVALHLWLNLPLVWRHLTRRRPGPRQPTERPASAAPVPARRPVLLALLSLGSLGGMAGAYRLGQQHARAEPSAQAGPQPPALPEPQAVERPATAAAADARGFVARFHALSSSARRGALLQAPLVAWGNAPPAFKAYPAALRVALPGPRRGAAEGLTVQALASVLWHTAGISARRGGLELRASPSSGGLFSTELYVLNLGVQGLAPGLWHHDARTDALHHLADAGSLHRIGLPAAAAHGTAAWVVATAVFRRTGHKYRDRAYRYVLVDLGHALENLRVAAHAAGLRARLLDRFDEARLAAALGLDEAVEGVLAVVALDGGNGPDDAPADVPASPPADVRAAAAGPMAWQPALAGDAGTLARDAPAGLPLGITQALHLASSLRGPVALDTRRRLPVAPVRAGVDWPTVIAHRRSVRRFADTPLQHAALHGVLAGLHAAVALLSPAVRVHVIVHAVEGLSPGAYRHEPGSGSGPGILVRQGADGLLRRVARAAALDQDVIGDAAAVFVLTITHAAWTADPAGPARGYRHALLEAGLVGERLYLEAGARGLGLCAVGAFFDDEAQALIGVDPEEAWVVHFAGLGVPA